MKLSTFLSVFLLMINTQPSFSQGYDVPKNYELKVAADYTTYEKDVIAAAKWLKSTPLFEEEQMHKEVSAFILNWVNGSPTVNVELNNTIFKFEEKNKGMMILYMAFCARYVLENNYSKDMKAKQIYALRGMVEVYRATKGISRDKSMEKLIKSDEGGNIENWLSDNLKVNTH